MNLIASVGLALALSSALGCAAYASPNLLVNGSFETGDLTGWTQSGNTSYIFVAKEGASWYGANRGLYYVMEGPIGSDGFLSQTFADTPGATLHVSGWLAGNGTSPSDFEMGMDGITYIDVNPVPNQPYTQYSFTATATGSDTVMVGFRNDPSWDAIDNFVVTDGVSVPEPASLFLLGSGLLVSALARRRRRNG